MNRVQARLRYWRRIFSAYSARRPSHLSFWHGTPELNDQAEPGTVDQYWQRFRAKARYPGPFDARGVPMLDYHGHVGLQYNPIAVAQWGLGNYNAFRSDADADARRKFMLAADWLVEHLEPNSAGLRVWNHHFDWEYRTPLKAPWYSALSQGQGVSLLVRAHAHTGSAHFLDAARDAALSFRKPLDEGGVSHWDAEGRVWFEETVVDPPTHILNGFLWASWGLYDLAVHAGDDQARALFDQGNETLEACLSRFDMGYWSMYDLPGVRLRNPASPFYHALHVVQLRIQHRLAGRDAFRRFADRWDACQRNRVRKARAVARKAVFKLAHY